MTFISVFVIQKKNEDSLILYFQNSLIFFKVSPAKFYYFYFIIQINGTKNQFNYDNINFINPSAFKSK